MSARKSEVVAYGIEDHETAQLWAVEIELRGAKMRSDEYGDKIVPLVPEALLLDARATGLKLMGDLQRAEALAGERLAALVRIKEKLEPDVIAWDEYGVGYKMNFADVKEVLDTAIDAVGGRGET